MEDDMMEMGDSGLVPMADGWFLHKPSGNRIAPNGKIYDTNGNIIGEVYFENTDD